VKFTTLAISDLLNPGITATAADMHIRQHSEFMANTLY